MTIARSPRASSKNAASEGAAGVVAPTAAPAFGAHAEPPLSDILLALALQAPRGA